MSAGAVAQPMLMIDGERAIRMKNAGAVALLARKDLLLDGQGILLCRDAESDRRFAAAIRTLCIAGQEERRVLWLRGAMGRCAAAILHALWPEGGSLQILISVIDPAAVPNVDRHLLRTAFGLTAAQARLAALIAVGHSPARCANELGVKTSTVRSHLAALYQKTGVAGRPGLVRIVLSIGAI